MASTPTDVHQGYGYMNWFLNSDKEGKTKSIPAAPKTAVTFRGAGSNIIYIDWENDIVCVVRWIDRTKFNQFIKLMLTALD